MKMEVEIDGTVKIPVKGSERGAEPRVITLDEPGMLQLAQLHDRVSKADEELPEALPLPNLAEGVEPTEEQRQMLVAVAERNQERTLAIYGEKLPYGHIVLDLIKQLGYADGVNVDELTVDDLFGWASSPLVCRTLLETWRSPLPGKASLLTATT